MSYANTPQEYIGFREARLAREAKETPVARCKDAQREYNGNLRLAFVKALMASGGHALFQERCKVSSNPRAVYLETCAELGIEVAELDPR